MKLLSYNELDMDARSHASSVGWDELRAIADKEGVEAANKMLDSWKFLEDGTRVDEPKPELHVFVCGPKQRETIESCPGCDTPLDELENGGVEHSCECGHELTAKECEEQNGMCERCNWLMS